MKVCESGCRVAVLGFNADERAQDPQTLLDFARRATRRATRLDTTRLVSRCYPTRTLPDSYPGLTSRAAFRLSGFGFRGSGFDFWVSAFGFGVWGLGFEASDSESRLSDLRFRVPDFGFRESGIGIRVPGFGFQISGFGFQISGLRFRVSGFGVQVSGVPSLDLVGLKEHEVPQFIDFHRHRPRPLGPPFLQERVCSTLRP